MARPIKDTVLYFPHYSDASTRKTLTILEGRFGIKGYALWFKLLECLASSEGHFIDCRLEVDMEFLSVKLRSNPIETTEILDLTSKLGAIDNELWSKKIIWSDNFTQNIEDAYKNRKRAVPLKPVITEDETPLNGGDNPQSKLNKRKVNNIKEDNNISETKVSDISLKLANQLKSLMLINDPKVKTPNDLTKWAFDIDKLLRLDKRTEQEVSEVIEYSQHSEFWKPNILSGSKLREKFTTLYLQMRNNGHKNTQGRKQDGENPIPE
jgi:hypothetical protein